MLDVAHILQYGNADVQVFNCEGFTVNTAPQIWRRPRGKTMAYAIVTGGGAGGGGGFTGIAGSARGGGGGGGAGAQTRMIFPLLYMPDILYIHVGKGGAGVGSGGGTAGAGNFSSVAFDKDFTASFILSGASAASGGTSGSAGSPGGAGAGGPVMAANSPNYSNLGIWTSAAGTAGSAAGAVAGAIGTALTLIPGISTILGGCGGGSTTSADFAGGSYNASNNMFISDGRPAAPAAGSFSGSAGTQFWKPFLSLGGCGGSAANSAAGGRGGDGAIGAGGGGGGGGTTGGQGGNGGDGQVVIISW